MTFLRQLADSPLLRRATFEAVLVGALCGVVGVHVVLRRLSFFSITIAHATFPGVVVASMAGVSLVAGGAVAAGVLVLVVGLLGSVRRVDTSTVTGIALAGTFAVGVLLQSARVGGAKDLSGFLVGSVLTADRADVVVTIVIGALVVVALALVHKELVLVAFDREAAGALGFSLLGLDLALLGLVAATVVVAVPAVGTVLVVTLLVAPALSARLVTDRLRPMLVMSAGLGALSSVLGMALATQARLAAGASIVLVNGAIFGVVLAGSMIVARRRPPPLAAA